MSKQTQRIEAIKGFINDLKSGEAISHQPKRKSRHSNWWINTLPKSEQEKYFSRR